MATGQVGNFQVFMFDALYGENGFYSMGGAAGRREIFSLAPKSVHYLEKLLRM